MIGTARVRSRSLISSAVSKPSSPGIWTSSRITAKSSWRRWRSASSPEFARTSSGPSGSRIASSASRFSGRSSTSRMLRAVAHRLTAQPVEEVGDLLEREDRVGAGGRDRRLRHLPALGRARVLDDRDAAAPLDRTRARARRPRSRRSARSRSRARGRRRRPTRRGRRSTAARTARARRPRARSGCRSTSRW